MRDLSMLALIVCLACEGVIGDPRGSHDTPRADDADAGIEVPPEVPECGEESFLVFERLKPTCFGCHREGTNLPFMASYTGFDALLVRDPRFVVPGRPEESDLVALLRGTSAGTFTQMPVGDQSFAELEDAGETGVSVEEVEAWIAGLEPCTVLPEAPPSEMRRLSTEQVLRSLKQQLGLTDEDVLTDNQNYAYPMYIPERVPRPSSAVEAEGHERWVAMGGDHVLNASPGNRALAPAFAQHLTQVSQAWCRRSVQKPGNDALFRHATPSTSSEDASAVRENIRYLFLRMLGVEASDAEVDAMFVEIFQHYEERESPEVAWVAVCATLVRDPLWITY